MAERIAIKDAFTSEPLSGNPAAVRLQDGDRDSPWMQRLAAEMNLSETAFLRPDAGGYRLRWFTPATEVDLCGHATLATAHIVWEEGHLAQQQAARFHTRSGARTASRACDVICLEFPAVPAEPTRAPPGPLEESPNSSRFSPSQLYEVSADPVC